MVTIGFACLDTSANESLTESTELVKVVEKRKGLKISCIEKIALNYKWGNKEAFFNEMRNLKGVSFKKKLRNKCL